MEETLESFIWTPVTSTWGCQFRICRLMFIVHALIGFTYIACRGNEKVLAIWIWARALAGSHVDSTEPTRVMLEPELAAVVGVVSSRIRDHTRCALLWSAFCPWSSLPLANFVIHSADVPSVSFNPDQTNQTPATPVKPTRRARPT